MKLKQSLFLARANDLIVAIMIMLAALTSAPVSSTRILSGRSSRTFLMGRIRRGGSTLDADNNNFHRKRAINTMSKSNSSDSSKRYRAILALGGNVGDTYGAFVRALSALGKDDDQCSLVRTSFLYKTRPMYVTEQPDFLNGAIEVETRLDAHSLLISIKDIEEKLGRQLAGKRNGPRPIDIDILFYGDRNEAIIEPTGNSTPNDLEVPHSKIQDREFVLAPLKDIDQNIMHPTLGKTVKQLFADLVDVDSQDMSAEKTIPLPRNRFLTFNETIVMGIINATPDSFSDGGQASTVDRAIEKAIQLIKDGAGIIDIGGESTRPGAKEVMIEDEMNRTIPVIKKLREVSDIPISIDTRHSKVARAAIDAGADIVNDVSGGAFDPDMLPTVADLHVPFVIMHMRGTPETMQSMTQYHDVVMEVASSLQEQSRRAEMAGIPRWLQILDPGLGFAKDFDGNLSLLRGIDKLRDLLSGAPLLLGPSRKGFIGKITGVKKPEDRDSGTIGVCAAAVSRGGSNIVRVHNVKAVKHAMMIVDAIKSSNN